MQLKGLAPSVAAIRRFVDVHSDLYKVGPERQFDNQIGIAKRIEGKVRICHSVPAWRQRRLIK